MEVEIKLNVKAAVEGGPLGFFTRLTSVNQLGAYPLGPIKQHEIRDLYYDTADGILAKNGAGFRSRWQDGKELITLKRNRVQDGSLVTRDEYEEPLTPERAEWVLSHIKDLIGEGPHPAVALWEGKPCGNLLPVLRVDSARLTRAVGDVATLTMDIIRYPGIATNAYFDIEIEAKEGTGTEAALRDIEADIHRLARGYVAPAGESKLERGLRLKGKAN
ncbi:MAG: CYTH domain-containing protein [Mycobacterium leprae]